MDPGVLKIDQMILTSVIYPIENVFNQVNEKFCLKRMILLAIFADVYAAKETQFKLDNQ